VLEHLRRRCSWQRQLVSGNCYLVSSSLHPRVIFTLTVPTLVLLQIVHPSESFCMTICPSACLFAPLPAFLPVCPSDSLLSSNLSVCLTACPSACHPLCLSHGARHHHRNEDPMYCCQIGSKYPIFMSIRTRHILFLPVMQVALLPRRQWCIKGVLRVCSMSNAGLWFTAAK
jgi:hypothetical protein